jgi:hypothetical protein
MICFVSGNGRRFVLSVAATLAAAAAQDIGVFHADPVQQHRRESGQQPARPQEPQISTPAYTRGLSNPVEPLSNGLSLAFTKADILNRFGEPTERTWDSRTFGYGSFRVQVGGAREEIWRIRLTGSEVALSSGIRIGSRKRDVEAVLGSAYRADIGQYSLQFSYSGERVTEILIEPANGSFAPVAAPRRNQSQPPVAAVTTQPANGSETSPRTPQGNRSQSSVPGVWQFIVPSSTLGEIELRADGTYVGRPAGGGTWRLEGRDFQFTGTLTFNHGRGKLNEDGTLIEFNYKNDGGFAQYFVLKKK